MEAGGSLLWRDDLVCGRHGEDSGDFVADTLIRYDGSTLYRHELSVGPRAAGWSGPAILGDARAVGTVVTAGHVLAETEAGPNAAVMPLAGAGMLATAIGADIRAVRAALDPFCVAHGEGRPKPPSHRKDHAATAIGTP